MLRPPPLPADGMAAQRVLPLTKVASLRHIARKFTITAGVAAAGLVAAACGGSSNSPQSTGGSSSASVPTVSATSFTRDYSAMTALQPLTGRGKGNVAVILPDTVSSARYVEFDAPYLTKPFSIEELLARIVATLRRTRPAAPPEAAPQTLVAGDIVIDLASQQVTSHGRPVHLTPTEFALLRELAINRGKLLTHSYLLRRVWGQGYVTQTEYVRVYVRRLRAKLEADGSPPLILTHPRAGYRMAPG